MMSVAIAFAQQISGKSVTIDSSCVLGANTAVEEAIGTCMAA